MMNEYFKAPKVIGKVIKDFVALKYPMFNPTIFIPGQKVVLPNTTELQIVFQKRSNQDFSNTNTLQNASLPDENVQKLISETYAINFRAYTTDSQGFNVAYAIAPFVTAIFNTQKALYEFQKVKIRLPLIGEIKDVSSVEGVENLVRLILEIQVLQLVSINTSAEYYDDFTNGYNINFSD